MGTNYIEKKINTEKFKQHFENILLKIKDKKVLIYGTGLAYKLISKKFDLSKLNIVAVADKSFKEEGKFESYKAIPPEKIKEEDFDVILIMIQRYKIIESFLEYDLELSDEIPVYAALEELVNGECSHLDYLQYWNFEENFEKLCKKVKNKKVLLYGAGSFFETIKLYFDLDKLNIIGISDKRFEKIEGEEKEIEEEFYGYKTYSPQEIKALKPDYVLVSTLKVISIIENLEQELKGTRIKILPLMDKSFWQLLKEIWS